MPRAERVLVTTLTKKMAEDPVATSATWRRVRYMHSEVETLERIRYFAICGEESSMFWWASTFCEGLTFPRFL